MSNVIYNGPGSTNILIMMVAAAAIVVARAAIVTQRATTPVIMMMMTMMATEAEGCDHRRPYDTNAVVVVVREGVGARVHTDVD
jgi:hypothetical protein